MSRGQLARFAFGLLVASALAIGGVVAGLHTRSKPADRTQPVGAAVAPLQASGAFLCPGGHPVPAYPSGFSYPPGHPSAPSNTVRPSACYATAADATAAGYPPAVPPPRARIVHGIYLVPVDKHLVQQCQAAARALKFAVPCPGLLPTSSSPPACDANGDGACVAGRVFVFMQIGFDVPGDYVGVDGRAEGHLVLTGSRHPDDELVNCFGGRKVDAIKLPASTASLIECPAASGLHGGHLMLRWQAGSLSIALSLHGITDVNRALLSVIARDIHLTAP